MAISPGKRLGPYEVLSAIGAGGMGEVYKARDTRLERTVAIKVLPPHLADRAESHERFEREAKTIASLNHPHICTLFDTGHQDEIDFLVMEFIEGETLAQRLAKGPLPLEQVLRYAIEIADALNKAHRKGITHRDLKPGNIMLTKTGTKLLDFGLAKLAPASTPATSDSQLPTMKDAITEQGTILGTLQYMAPEQVEGKEADARTDIFAFGVVIYEMATGKRAFEGKSRASLMAKILETDPPPMTALTPMTPPALDHIVKRCLAKDPDERWQSAKDICEQLKWISDSAPQSGATAAAAPAQKGRNLIAWAAAGIAIVIVVIAVAAPYLRRSRTTEKQAVRFTIDPPEQGAFAGGGQGALSVSPDGSKVTYAAIVGSGGPQLWIRSLDSPTAQVLPGTEGAIYPFWSHDGRFLAFSLAGKLKKIPISGGPAETIAEARANPAAWSREGVILFEANDGRLNRIPESGGDAIPVTTLDATRAETLHNAPQFLPDGKHFLYLAVSSKAENMAVFVGSLDSKEKKLILNVNSNAIYVSPGFLLFHREGTLMAQPFDVDRLQLSGEATPIVEGIGYNPFGGGGSFDASDNGVLIYRSGGGAAPLSLVWVNRNGTEQPLSAPRHNYTFPRISPDGKRIATGIEEAEGQIWLYDIARDALSRLTFEGSINVDPVWTPDGKRIAFKGSGNRLFWKPADGGGSAEELTSSLPAQNDIPISWSPDGKELAFLRGGAVRNTWIFSLKDHTAHVLVAGPAYESAPEFSPDGRWMSYVSTESGRNEVYVRPYPGPGGKWQISTVGGTEPAWNPKGHELFYREGQKMMVVDYTEQPTFSAGKPRILFQGPFTPTPRSATDYDVSSDGQRFLMLKSSGQAPGEISVVLNWTEQLKQKPLAGNK
jgi:Tol biopolymer transport system component/predicted Ser/Thr protein kinase